MNLDKIYTNIIEDVYVPEVLSSPGQHTYSEDHIIDTTKSAEWNKNEVKRLNSEFYETWRKQSNLLTNKFHEDVIKAATLDYPNLSKQSILMLLNNTLNNRSIISNSNMKEIFKDFKDALTIASKTVNIECGKSNVRQKILMKELGDVLTKLARECENDDDFNSTIAELNIFNKSIDEAANDCFEYIEK